MVREQSSHEQCPDLPPTGRPLRRTLRTVVCEPRGFGGAKGRRVGAASSKSVGSQCGRPRHTGGADSGYHGRVGGGCRHLQPGTSSAASNRTHSRPQGTCNDLHRVSTAGLRRLCHAASTTAPGHPHTRESLLVVRRGSLRGAKRLSPAAAEAAFGRRANPVHRLRRTIVRA